MLRTLFFYIIFFPWTLVASLLALLISLLGQDKTHPFVHFWGRTCAWLAGVKIVVQGSEYITTTEPAIYVSNHQSNFDIPIIYTGLKTPFSWLAKKELFRVPLFGLGMKRNGCIPIDRSNRRATMHSIIAAAQQIKAGTSIVIFPEGTRSVDGQLQKFKKGALLIAAKAQVPIIPIAIHGSHQILPKGRWKITPGTVSINFFPPIMTDNLKTSDIDSLTNTVHDQIAASLQGATIHA